MNRNHIHMAAGLLGESDVISGMRKTCNLYIYIDAAKAIQGTNTEERKITPLQLVLFLPRVLTIFFHFFLALI